MPSFKIVCVKEGRFFWSFFFLGTVDASQGMEHPSGTEQLVAIHPRSRLRMADEESAKVQREDSGNSSSRFSSWSVGPLSSVWSTTRGGTLQCKGPHNSQRVRPRKQGCKTPKRRLKCVPSQTGWRRVVQSFQRKGEKTDHHWPRRSFPG